MVLTLHNLTLAYNMLGHYGPKFRVGRMPHSSSRRLQVAITISWLRDLVTHNLSLGLIGPRPLVIVSMANWPSMWPSVFSCLVMRTHGQLETPTLGLLELNWSLSFGKHQDGRQNDHRTACSWETKHILLWMVRLIS